MEVSLGPSRVLHNHVILRRFHHRDTRTPHLSRLCPSPSPCNRCSSLCLSHFTSTWIFLCLESYNMAFCVCLQNIRVIPRFSNFFRDHIGYFRYSESSAKTNNETAQHKTNNCFVWYTASQLQRKTLPFEKEQSCYPVCFATCWKEPPVPTEQWPS